LVDGSGTLDKYTLLVPNASGNGEFGEKLSGFEIAEPGVAFSQTFNAFGCSDKLNPETGLMEHYDGHLFDEGVFNDSVREFLRKRRELADYFDESKTEDIFDYIPPQKTNQIFTPKRIVKMMVDKLEEENPGCFDDPEHTFADLYMKSGLYITEIVKRLYRSEEMKIWFPDDQERIRHILRKQVFGMAPSRIIYLIATNYILGFDDELKEEFIREQKNFVEADAAEAAKAGTLKELVDQKFGG